MSRLSILSFVLLSQLSILSVAAPILYYIREIMKIVNAYCKILYIVL